MFKAVTQKSSQLFKKYQKRLSLGEMTLMMTIIHASQHDNDVDDDAYRVADDNGDDDYDNDDDDAYDDDGDTDAHNIRFRDEVVVDDDDDDDDGAYADADADFHLPPQGEKHMLFYLVHLEICIRGLWDRQAEVCQSIALYCCQQIFLLIDVESGSSLLTPKGVPPETSVTAHSAFI
uniref:Uncharacterized protein n=1 Tax=Glossina pallidipes TaxID=7398 RepID=A0A1A9ZPL2_GLOPL